MQIWCRWTEVYCQTGKTYAMVSFAKILFQKGKVVALFCAKQSFFWVSNKIAQFFHNIRKINHDVISGLKAASEKTFYKYNFTQRFHIGK